MENTDETKSELCRVSLATAAIYGGAAFTALVIVWLVLLFATSAGNGHGGDVVLVMILMFAAPMIYGIGAFMGAWGASVYNLVACDDADTVVDGMTAGIGAPFIAFFVALASAGHA